MLVISVTLPSLRTASADSYSIPASAGVIIRSPKVTAAPPNEKTSSPISTLAAIGPDNSMVSRDASYVRLRPAKSAWAGWLGSICAAAICADSAPTNAVSVAAASSWMEIGRPAMLRMAKSPDCTDKLAAFRVRADPALVGAASAT